MNRFAFLEILNTIRWGVLSIERFWILGPNDILICYYTRNFLLIMPRSSKKRRAQLDQSAEQDNSPSSASSDHDSDQEESTNTGENVQIDLEARTPIDSDHSGILYFLAQSFGNANQKSALDLNQLTTQLIAQQTCGSVFYQPLDETDDDDDDDDYPVLGLCSMLRLDQQNMKPLQAWLLDKCAENEQAKGILQCKCDGY